MIKKLRDCHFRQPLNFYSVLTINEKSIYPLPKEVNTSLNAEEWAIVVFWKAIGIMLLDFSRLV